MSFTFSSYYNYDNAEKNPPKAQKYFSKGLSPPHKLEKLSVIVQWGMNQEAQRRLHRVFYAYFLLQ